MLSLKANYSLLLPVMIFIDEFISSLMFFIICKTERDVNLPCVNKKYKFLRRFCTRNGNKKITEYEIIRKNSPFFHFQCRLELHGGFRHFH